MAANQQAKMKAFCAAIRAGNTIHDAAALAEIEQRTYYRWRDGDGAVYDAFRRDLARAQADFINRNLQRVEAAGQLINDKTGLQDWRALAWLLEHRYPDRFATRVTQEVSGPGGGPVQVKHEMDDVQVEERLGKVSAILREAGLLEPVEVHTNGNGNGKGV